MEAKTIKPCFAQLCTMTRTIWVSLFSLAAMTAGLSGAVLDVTRFGATPNDATDDTAAIQRAINASVVGDTISFPSGEYRLSQTLILKSDRSYSAEAGVSLKQLATNTFIAATEYDHGQNLTLSGLTFEGGGLLCAGSGNVPAKSILITNCTFKNITSKTYPMNSAIYIPIGGFHCNIVANTFSNIMGDNAICAWRLASCGITDNYFDISRRRCAAACAGISSASAICTAWRASAGSLENTTNRKSRDRFFEFEREWGMNGPPVNRLADPDLHAQES